MSRSSVLQYVPELAFLGALLVSGVALAGPGVEAPSASKEKPVISSIQAGLAREHAEQTPLLDRIAHGRQGAYKASRTYRDGTNYKIFQGSPGTPGYQTEPAWKPFITVTPSGIAQLETVIRDQLMPYDKPHDPDLSPPGSGRITWVAWLDGKEHVAVTASGSYAHLPEFVKAIDEAVSQNVEPNSYRSKQ
jgi:hypothetical protein